MLIVLLHWMLFQQLLTIMVRPILHNHITRPCLDDPTYHHLYLPHWHSLPRETLKHQRFVDKKVLLQSFDGKEYRQKKTWVTKKYFLWHDNRKEQLTSYASTGKIKSFIKHVRNVMNAKKIYQIIYQYSGNWTGEIMYRHYLIFKYRIILVQ